MNGDGAAIDALWRENRRWIAAVLLAHKPAFDDLDDLLQDVAVTMVSKMHTLREPGYLKAWLRTVAINVARASARSSKTRPTVHLSDGDTRVPALPEQYREPLMLRAMHGMRSRQIAEIMGIPEATVDTRVARARRMLLERARGPANTPHEGADAS